MSSVFRSPSRMKRICRLNRCIRSWLPRTLSASSLSTSSAWQISQLNVPDAKSMSLSASRGENDFRHWGQMYPLLSSCCSSRFSVARGIAASLLTFLSVESIRLCISATRHFTTLQNCV